jgi:hypothetical protein
VLKPKQVLDGYFPEVRAWLIQIAAVMDRCDRAAAAGEPVDGDPRLKQYQQSLEVLMKTRHQPNRAETIQRIFSDPV